MGRTASGPSRAEPRGSPGSRSIDARSAGFDHCLHPGPQRCPCTSDTDPGNALRRLCPPRRATRSISPSPARVSQAQSGRGAAARVLAEITWAELELPTIRARSSAQISPRNARSPAPPRAAIRVAPVPGDDAAILRQLGGDHALHVAGPAAAGGQDDRGAAAELLVLERASWDLKPRHSDQRTES